MVQIQCPIPGCNYGTPDVSEAIACALLAAHSPIHLHSPQQATALSRGPKMERPKIDMGVTPEEWNVFTRRWDAFVAGSGLDAADSSSQLFQCAGDALGDNLLKNDRQIFSRPTPEVMAAMKSLAVIAVATGVQRAELMQMRQERDEVFRSFSARVRGKAETCSYNTACACHRSVDFTDVIIRDVLIAGIYDPDIRREILGTDSILQRPVNDVISLVESKEMARNAMPSTAASISTFKQEKSFSQSRGPPKIIPSTQNQTASCPECKQTFAIFSEGSRGWNMKPHKLCLKCYRSRRNNKRNNTVASNSEQTADLATVFAQLSAIRHTPTNRTAHSSSLPHHIFTKGEWRRASSLRHPEVKLTASVEKSDYLSFNRKCPKVKSTMITAMVDSGAQSCLWSLSGFLAAGFSKSDLIPSTMNLVAANKSPISICGAIILRLRGQDNSDPTCATMVYVSEKAHGFYLSCEAMVDLAIVPLNFPSVGSVAPVRECILPSINTVGTPDKNLPTSEQECKCPTRQETPSRPLVLPFDCCPSNNVRMKEWLLDYFGASTFNTCPHNPLPCMTGPPVEIHLAEDTLPRAVHTPASIPIHWQEQVHADLLRDESLGVIEKVPYGEAVTWCHRMVVTRKHDGTPRRTVDLSPLNKHCTRETFAAESPFHLARRIPKGTWKTVSDAWNGYHSVPLRESDRHLTTFITPFGRWRYLRAPQGFLSSGDGYNRRFDAILTDFQRKERCVDDTIHYDADLRDHWWRTIDFLILVGKAGIVLNPQKFQFAETTVDFAGFRISKNAIEPLPKYINAIKDFPKPTSTTDIRSWFGLVNQVSNYAQIRDTMAPFKPFLSPKHKFEWTPELDTAFSDSKLSIIEAIRHGVEIFEPTKRTCLRPDWSHLGIGYFLSQKHCLCPSELPDCCTDGWKITLAGSRFLSSTEQRYAPIEGEALAVAWGLEQSKYFTQGCNNLVIVTDHKPLVKILGDRTLDEISNTRIFRLKQRTLPWSFDIAHLPGRTNLAADATSRHPSPTNEYADSVNLSLNSLMDNAECMMIAAIQRDANNLTALTWETIAAETATDPTMQQLMHAIEEGFPDKSRRNNDGVAAFWLYRESLYIADGVVLYQDRVVIPTSLRENVLRILHSAHQGISSMESRARAIVFWPGITDAIRSTREKCSACNRIAPSQAATPSIPSTVPSTPFESIFADYFDCAGCHYLVAGDRLSGWVEIFRAPHGTASAGSQGLISALRSLFATFGIPEELSSDGGSEFKSSSTADFLARWGVHHRISSSYFPQSNGRAEVAVKKAKRTLMANIGPSGSLDNDGLLRAMLQLRNTPDPDCNISPAEIVFGRPIRDAFSFVNRCSKYRNPSIRPIWREAWAQKEQAMHARFTRTTESLNQHSRSLARLQPGDCVFIQNGHGPHPLKWDKSGVVVDVMEHDQYIVKVNGSGRTTMRNRRFLRKFTPASATVQPSPVDVHSTYNDRPSAPLTQDTSNVEIEQLPTPDDPIEQETSVANPPSSPPTQTAMPPSIPISPSGSPRTMNPAPPTPTIRSQRNPVPRRWYEPETGKWK